MSTEQTEPSSHYGDDGHGAGSNSAPVHASGDGSTSQAANGTGSASGRRRRRRRKNKGPGTAPAGSQPGVESKSESRQDDAAIAVAAAPAPAQPTAQQQPGHGQGKRKNGRKRTNGGGGSNAQAGPQPGNGGSRPRQNRQNGGGAWKARTEGPDGNREGARGGFGSELFNDANGGGSRRKGGKFGRRGPSSFVGPMDHSYRAVNGNIADGPPSTMDYRNANGNANGNVNGRNDYFEAEPVSVQREDAPTRIVCFIEDLFVVAKMQETARKLGVKVQFLKAEKEVLAALMDAPEAERPSLIVFDLNNAGAKPLTVIPKLKNKLKRGTSIIGFLQHIQGDLKLKAIEAGCDSVMPKAAFSQNLPNLLRRHGFAEEEEMVEA